MSFDETRLQLQLQEIRKHKRRDSLPFPALTVKDSYANFNVQAQRLLSAEYFKWFAGDKRVFVFPTQTREDNSYRIKKTGNVFVPSAIREAIGNGVYKVVPSGGAYELVKPYMKRR